MKSVKKIVVIGTGRMGGPSRQHSQRERRTRGVHSFMPRQRADLAMWFCHSVPRRVSHYMNGKIIINLRR